MFTMFQAVTFNPWRSLLALILLILADWGMMTANPVFSGALDWTFLPIGGLLALISLIGWKNTQSLFKKIRKKDWGWIIFVIISGSLLSDIFILIGKLLNQTMAANAGGADWYEGLSVGGGVLYLSQLSVSLTGEELYIAAIFVLTFLLLSRFMPTKVSILTASTISLLVFGLSHYAVYDGNLYQCIFVIGLAHAPSLYAWLKTQNLWIPMLAHILYDLILFFIILLFGI
ncbi:CPBP family intramembrane metalloprotease [Enterococcus sp. DIV1298c]|uniref:CPBP family glutamic-type intramembrane protease n=1 Tax=Enterococcus sp. DIV1298c TaxID=2815328 RepID=UPI001A92135A|nr:CPBP family glutamic-type intramembrane protease [Enterococcus sp. DIV1298c]MBO0461076.1 CPBP family intramembrane metalloprotease [Enterococcus sp. DIV1298c]